MNQPPICPFSNGFHLYSTNTHERTHMVSGAVLPRGDYLIRASILELPTILFGLGFTMCFLEVADDHYKDQITSRRAQGVPGRDLARLLKDIRMLQPQG